jgi:hypothetical protein
MSTVCTVDLEIPNFLAVSLTVAFELMIKSATCMALSSIYAFKEIAPPYRIILFIYMSMYKKL